MSIRSFFSAARAIASSRSHQRAKEAALRFVELDAVRDEKRIAALWDELFPNSSHPTPAASWAWAKVWWQEFGATLPARRARRLFVVAVERENGEVIALAPFHMPVPKWRVPWPRTVLQRRDLRMIGDLGDTNELMQAGAQWAGWGLMEEPVMLLKRDCEEEALRGLTDYFLRGGGGNCDLLSLQFVHAPEKPFEVLDWTDWRARGVKREEASLELLPLPSSWADFRAGLSKSMRDNLAYYPRLLTRRGHKHRVRIARSPEDVQAAADLLVDLHGMRSQSDRGLRHTNYLPFPEHRRFVRTGLGGLAQSGKAQVFVLEIEEENGSARPIAALAALHFGGMRTFLVSGFDPAWYEFSPLFVLTAFAIEDAIATGTQTVSFLSGKMAAKARWGARPGLVAARLVVLRPRPLSLVRAFWTQRSARARAQNQDQGDNQAPSDETN